MSTVFALLLGSVASFGQYTDTMRIDLSLFMKEKRSQGGNTTQGCSTAPNDNCTTADTLVVGAAPKSGTTCDGTILAFEIPDCLTSTNSTASVWYRFVATAASLTVTIFQNSGGCYLSSAVWKTPPCSGASCDILSCQSKANGLIRTEHVLSNLIVGNTYWVQVLYTPGGICGQSASYFIWVSTTIPSTPSNPAPQSTCANPFTGCIFSYVPTVADVITYCPQHAFPVTAEDTNKVLQGCMTINTGNTTSIGVQVVISSNCPSGNVAWATATLCDNTGTIIGCTNILTNPYFTVTCNTTVCICFAWENTACSDYYYYWPFAYANNTGCGLPVELLDFSAQYEASRDVVRLHWSTASEINNGYFCVERSSDAQVFTEQIRVKGSGTTTGVVSYKAIDDAPLRGVSYYRLKQVDYDGHFHTRQYVQLLSKSKVE